MPCWNQWFVAHKQEFVEGASSQRCSTCNHRRRRGWWGDISWHCCRCWRHYFVSKMGRCGHRVWRAYVMQHCETCGHRRREGWKGYEAWHCKNCWRVWYAQFGAEGLKQFREYDARRVRSALSPSSDWPLLAGRGGSSEEHFDFIEIGTSNYNTFTHACAGHPLGKDYAWSFLPKDKDPLKLRGLAVDLQPEYLAQLPDLPLVSKVCTAVSEFTGTTSVHHVPLRTIERWEARFAYCGGGHGFHAMQLARACSALGKHRVLWKTLGEVGLRRLLRTRSVRVISVGALLRRHRVAGVNVMALDCEGHDCAILRGLMRTAKARPELYPRYLIFETNGMNDDLFGEGTEERTVRQLQECGYQLWYGGGYRVSGCRDTVLYRPGEEKKQWAEPEQFAARLSEVSPSANPLQPPPPLQPHTGAVTC